MRNGFVDPGEPKVYFEAIRRAKLLLKGDRIDTAHESISQAVCLRWGDELGEKVSDAIAGKEITDQEMTDAFRNAYPHFEISEAALEQELRLVDAIARHIDGGDHVGIAISRYCHEARSVACCGTESAVIERTLRD